MKVAFAGTFSVRLTDVDMLVTLAFTPELGAAARRLKLVQAAGAGLNRSEMAMSFWLRQAGAEAQRLIT